MIELPPMWPHQAYAVTEIPRLIASGQRKILLTSPTGGGKTRTICELIQWGLQWSYRPVLYTNRRLLIDQLSRVLAANGIKFGIRAANHQDNRHLDVQISSLPTERKRVFDSEAWKLHGAGQKALAIVDECHMNRADTAKKILEIHHADGGAYIGVTATPIGLKELYDSLVIAGTMSELRKCGCLVPAYHFGPDEPDMRDFKQNVKTGEFSEGDVRKAIMNKAIFGRVLDHYRTLNPEQRPCILFGPGVPESIWFAEKLTEAGIRSAHIDGEGYWVDGEYTRSTNREWLLKAVKDGEIKVLCNRFVLREGLDLPEVSHIILATVMGALQTYLQSVGRGLRTFQGKDRLTIQDHGGHWHRHGSVNLDREWNLSMTESLLRSERQERFQQKQAQEPIRCAQCGMIRNSGPKCPKCGFETRKKTRVVIQSDGTLREHTGDIYKPRVVKSYSDTEKKWNQCYYQAKNSRNRMTFRQAEGLFFKENGYWPPRDIPLMPVDSTDFLLPVADVPRERLTYPNPETVEA